MDTLNEYRDKLVQILREWERFPGPEADFRIEAVIDRDKDRYLLQDLNWEEGRRIYYTLVHVDIIEANSGYSRTTPKRASQRNCLPQESPKTKLCWPFTQNNSANKANLP